MNLKTNPELLPVVEWWEKDGKSTVVILLVAALCVAGFYGYRHYRAAERAAASEAVASAFSMEELEDAVAKYAGKPTEGVLKLRLARSYFDAEHFDTALETYEALAGKEPQGFEGVAAVGRAQCLEALKRYDEAMLAYDEFAQAVQNGDSPLRLTAQLGVARCVALKGDSKSALEKLAELKVSVGDDEIAKARIESAEDLVKRIIR